MRSQGSSRMEAVHCVPFSGLCVSALQMMENAGVKSPVQGQCVLSVPTVGNWRSHEKGSVCKMEESLKSSALASLVFVLQRAWLSSVWCPVHGRAGSCWLGVGVGDLCLLRRQGRVVTLSLQVRESVGPRPGCGCSLGNRAAGLGI